MIIELLPTRPDYVHVFVDGEQVGEEEYLGHGERLVDLRVCRPRDMDILSRAPVGEIFKVFRSVYLPDTAFEDGIEAGVSASFDEDGFWLTLTVTMQVHEWRRPYSFGDLYRTIQSLPPERIRPLQVREYYEDGGSGPAFELRWEEAVPPAAILSDIVRAGEQWLRNALQSADDRLRGQTDALVHVFNFPSSVRSACVQYLSYFVQFLSDLGIEADSTIAQEASRVLFRVSPKDNRDALEKIQQALRIYLELPTVPTINTLDGEYDHVAVAQLRANIAFLQSQLLLAAATIEAKDETIAVLRMPHVGKDVGEANVNEESVLGGLITVTEYEKNGFRINLPELFRRLRRSR